MTIWVVKIFFVQFFCVFLPPLLNIFCFVMSTPFLSFNEPIFAWNVPLVFLIFLKRSLVFSHSIVFLYFFDHWGRHSYLSLLFFGTLHSNGYIFPFLLCLSSLLFFAICKTSLDNYFDFLYFFFLGMVLITASCTSWTSLHSSSGTLSDLILWVY